MVRKYGLYDTESLKFFKISFVIWSMLPIYLLAQAYYFSSDFISLIIFSLLNLFIILLRYLKISCYVYGFFFYITDFSASVFWVNSLILSCNSLKRSSTIAFLAYMQSITFLFHLYDFLFLRCLHLFMFVVDLFFISFLFEVLNIFLLIFYQTIL